MLMQVRSLDCKIIKSTVAKQILLYISLSYLHCLKMKKVNGAQRKLPTLSLKSSRSFPLTPPLLAESLSFPQVYNWDTSLPDNWEKFSPRPLKRAQGMAGFRSTLDFLLETQKYIVKITDRDFSPRAEPRYPVSRLRPQLFFAPSPTSPSALLGSDRPVMRVSYRVKKSRPSKSPILTQGSRRKLLQAGLVKK